MHVSKDTHTRKAADTRFFLQHESIGVDSCHLDLEKIKGVSSKIVFVAGKESKGNFLYRLAVNTAKDTGASFFEVVGHHIGYGQYPEGFSKEMIELLNT